MGLIMQHEDRSDEWIHVQQPDPLKVIIVGGGIGGLTAALALRQQGHHVQIYESSSFGREVGAALNVSPGTNGILKRLGIVCSEVGANVCTTMSEYAANGTKAKEINILQNMKIFQHSFRLAHRVRLHEALKKAATQENGEGPPAVLHLSKAVQDLDPATATVYFKDGTTVQGDVVLGADGVHSVCRKKLTVGHIEPFPSGQSAFRFMIPRSEVLADPRTSRFAGHDGNFSGIFGTDRSLVMYPCSDNAYLNFVCIHPESASATTGGWGSHSAKSDLLEVYRDFHPDILTLLAKADESSLKAWKLLDMNELPTWTQDRLAVLGDAAHPFLPYLGMGAGVAIEDGVSIGIVLEAGLAKEEVPERLKLFERIRKERATTVQLYTRLSGKKRGEKTSFDAAKYQGYCFAWDEFDHSHQMLREWKWSRMPASSNRLTSVFGPVPIGGKNILPNFKPTFTTASIRFKTSKTVVQTLLPPGNTSYQMNFPGSLAQCTFSQTSFRGVPRLGGRGFNVLGLYVHNVEYRETEEKTVVGAYLPIIFENLADASNTISGKNSNAPRAWSTIDIERDRRSYHVRAGWEGMTWGNFYLDELESKPVTSATDATVAQIEEGKLFHHYLPEATTDAIDQKRPHRRFEKTVFVPYTSEDDERKPEVQRVWKAKNVHLSLNARDWESLPTLHHIISRLQEIPVLEVIEAKIEEGTGSPDLA